MRATWPDADVRLVESSGGAFEVSLDGDLLFSKLQERRHATEGEVMTLLRERLPA